MIFWSFDNDANIWERAMIPPFNWSIDAHLDFFGIETGSRTYFHDRSRRERVSRCVASTALRGDSSGSKHISRMVHADSRDVWKFLFRPTADVERVVQDVLARVGDQVMISVHFRSQFIGQHHACGCQDPTEIGRCASNLPQVMRDRGLQEFNNSKKHVFFVASDSERGIDAFRDAFGEGRILVLPDTMPIEHSLEVTDDGAVRAFAEFLLLGKGSAVIGSCGSTFSERSMRLSQLPNSAVVVTGTVESAQCASGAEKLDFSAFSKLAKGADCDCYGGSDTRAGSCFHQCKKTLQERPSKCLMSLSQFVNDIDFDKTNLYFDKTRARGPGCTSKTAVYHHDAMSPFGFGSQYNHFMIFLVLAGLSHRVPVEEGPWTLGCNEHPVHEGFLTCWLDPRQTRTPCASKPNKYRQLWEDKVRDGAQWAKNNHYEREMVLDSSAEEWHFDGDVVRWFTRDLHFPCGSDHVEGEQSSLLTPLSTWAFAKEICEATGLDMISHLDMVRFASQKVAPIAGFSEARTWCRAAWGKKKVLAIHVRRGDKVEHEDALHEVSAYVAAATAKGWPFDLIFIATDDPEAVRREAEALSQRGAFDFVTYDHGNDTSWKQRNLGSSTATLIQETACMAEADYFVGSTRSNIAWLVQTLRTASPDTAIDLSQGPLRFF